MVNRMIGNVGIVLDLLLVLHFCWWIVVVGIRGVFGSVILYNV